MTPPLATKSANTRKRKSTGDILPCKPAKQARQTLEYFFAPQIQASSRPDEKQSVGLNAEQNKVLRMVVDEGKNVFFTGSAGTGKSLLLRAIIMALRKKYAKQHNSVAVTASTGMAASNIGGMTIHAWGAVAPTVQNVGTQIKCIKTCKPAHQRWKMTKVLVIDEVSMVDGNLFDLLAALAKELRKKTDKPFGGIQLVVTGDFFQLPPVSKGDPFFAFESSAWKSSIEHTVNLTQVYRQKESKFVDLLNDLRRGKISPEAITTFKYLSRPLPSDTSSIAPTELFPLRTEVDKSNFGRLKALPGSPHTFISRDSGSAAPEKRASLLKNMMATEKLELKVDAQVMLIKNADENLVNGSVGRVLGFFSLGSVESSAKTIQSIAGTGGTTHVRNVKLEPDGKRPIIVKRPGDEDKENKKKGKVKDKGKGKDQELYPLVEFCTPQGKEAILLVRDEFRYEDSEGNLLARRMQVPLILAWAMSIHKSQGQTIQRVKIDLGKVFEKGQSYVALSRAASLDGLQVLRFDPKKVMAHPKVIEWSKCLEETSL